ncbi:TPR repeat protein [Thecamonas trahens ATCC 50062]|uniref:TPR repeat protein n=1 Tax=Thecamonas trahens ATCC 50062 TaxID=461836 RepID=A0A0L0D762_THETB|nr:TPR repeat protein [Thecamonas trahens ATCC 50062]KNC48184.1 TPR repeat protein [Thecamonas trahens ATCC 50062]|eukprot:XP_013758753.1 TPR repeat protein [Thecamonas trahens ATCC 50062]
MDTDAFLAELHANKFAKCIKRLTAALRGGPATPRAEAELLANRAAANYALELHKRALKDAEAAIAADPGVLSGHVWKAKALAALGRADAAQAAAAAGLGHYGDLALMHTLGMLAEGDGASAKPAKPAQPALCADRGKARGVRLADGVAADPEYDVVHASEQVARRGLVQMGSGDPATDKAIALGYLAVNTGKLVEAVTHFSQLLDDNPSLVAAYVGRGTAMAMGGQLEAAVTDFTAALAVDPTCAEAHKRRGQSLAALDRLDEALVDLTAAVDGSDDPDARQQRGVLLHKMRNYRRAQVDLRAALTANNADPVAWNFLGLCLNSMGQCAKAVTAYTRALDLDPSFKEALVNLGSSYRELANYKLAMKHFDAVVALDPCYLHGRYLRGLTRYGAGELRAAITDLAAAASLDPSAKDATKLHAVALHALGRYSEALAAYNGVLAHHPSDPAWYQRELLIAVLPHLETPLRTFSLDRAMDPYFKEGWCKRHSPALLLEYTPLPTPSAKTLAAASVDLDAPLAPELGPMVVLADALSVRLQYHAPGFMTNARQHRMGGLAIVEMAQAAASLWATGPISVASTGASIGSHAHAFGWRDFYDIAVRWRQFSEPNDPVWWVDLLAPEQFAEGFGSQTPMVSGQLDVVRYHRVGYTRSFALVKALLPEQLADEVAMPSARAALATASTLDEVYAVVGHDFYVITPCYSCADPGAAPYEGTRLTLQAHPPEGYDFTIRTPCTPSRWKQFDAELTAAWDVVATAATALKADDSAETRRAFVDAALTLTFYWYNFMPLTRGSAMCGLLGLHALLLSVGLELDAPIPDSVQFDWEAILTPRPAPFIATLRELYVDDALRSVDPARDVSCLSTAVADSVITLVDFIRVVAAAEV